MPPPSSYLGRRAVLLTFGLMVGLPLALAPPALAEDRVIELLSGSGSSSSTSFEGASADGTRMFFSTTENMAGTGDADGARDVYQAQGGQITLLSGSGAANGVTVPFRGSSADGTRVFFTTSESIPGTGDGDGTTDLYRAEGGAITHLSVATGSPVTFEGASADGSRVFFSTVESIAGTGDSDGAIDVYQAQGGQITLLSGSGAVTNVTYEGESADGTCVFFSTTEAIAGTGDGDSGGDVYRAQGGTISLLSGTGASTAATFSGSSADGARVFFTTTQNMPGTGDSDSAQDVFQALAGSISLLSGDGDAAPATFRGSSADGTRVFFTTAEDIAGTPDLDAATDVYQAMAGSISLISNSGSAQPATFDGISADGTRVFFTTSENIPGTGDSDGNADLYQALAGSFTLLSGSGPQSILGFEGSSADGTRVFFTADGAIPGTGDGDTSDDVYEAHAGSITLLSGGAAEENASFNGASADGTRVFFDTPEAIPGTGDGDTGSDEYQSRLLPTPTPPVATPPVSGSPPTAPQPMKRCKKGQKLRKGKCVKRKRKGS